MGRIYDVTTNQRVRCYDEDGRKMCGVFRVEFYQETDDGFATVYLYLRDESGKFYTDGGKVAHGTRQMYARVRHRVPDSPAPESLEPYPRHLMNHRPPKSGADKIVVNYPDDRSPEGEIRKAIDQARHVAMSNGVVPKAFKLKLENVPTSEAALVCDGLTYNEYRERLGKPPIPPPLDEEPDAPHIVQ